MRLYRKVFTDKNMNCENYMFVYKGKKVYCKMLFNIPNTREVITPVWFYRGTYSGYIHKEMEAKLMKLLIRYGKMQILEDCLSGNKLALHLRDKYL